VHTAKPVARGLGRRVGHRLLRAAGGSARFAGAHCLNWRTRHRTVRAEHATVSRFWFEPNTASGAIIKELASVRWHRLHCLMTALGTSDH
jgi:hypothetical protein